MPIYLPLSTLQPTSLQTTPSLFPFSALIHAHKNPARKVVAFLGCSQKSPGETDSSSPLSASPNKATLDLKYLALRFYIHLLVCLIEPHTVCNHLLQCLSLKILIWTTTFADASPITFKTSSILAFLLYEPNKILIPFSLTAIHLDK